MDYIKHHVKLDFSKRNVRPTIAISGGDVNSHKIIFSFCNGLEPINITKATVCGVSINGIEPCNNVEINVSENTVEYIPALQFFREGTNPCILTLADARGKTLYAPAFYILVDDVYSDEIEENFCNDLKNNNAWGIVAKTVEYARIGYVSAESAVTAKEEAEAAKAIAIAAKNEAKDERVLAGGASSAALEYKNDAASAQLAAETAKCEALEALVAIGEDNESGLRGAAITAIGDAESNALVAIGEDNESGARGAAITAIGDARNESLELIQAQTSASIGLDYIGRGDPITHYVVSGIGSCTDSDIVIPETYMGIPVTQIAQGAFKNANITSVEIPSSVTEIETGSFANCSSLAKVKFFGGGLTIKENAFNNCPITCFDFIECESVPALEENSISSSITTDYKIRIRSEDFDEWRNKNTSYVSNLERVVTPASNADAIKSIDLSYDKYTQKLGISFVLNGIHTSKILDLDLERTIQDVEDDVDADGNPIIRFKFATKDDSGSTVYSNWFTLESLINLQNYVQKTEYDEDIKRVAALEKDMGTKADASTVTNLAATVGNKADASTVSALEKKVTQNATALESKADKTEVSTAKTELNDSIASVSENLEENYVKKEDCENLASTVTVLKKRVANLEGATLEFTEDSTVAYEKRVPVDASKYALVNKVGGMTRKCTNLLKSVEAHRNVTVENGVVKQDVADTREAIAVKVTGYNGSTFIETIGMVSNITTTGVVAIQIPKTNNLTMIIFGIIGAERDTLVNANVSHLVDGDTYTLSLNLTNITQGSISWCDMMLNEGSTARPYEPYFEGLRDTKVTELRSTGANILPYPYHHKTRTHNGITFTDNGDGTVTVNGTSTGVAVFSFSENNPSLLKIGKTYSISGETSPIQIGALFANVGWYRNMFTITEEMLQATDIYVEIRIPIGNTIENVTVYPMLNVGSTPAPYKPYVGTISTLEIPEKLRAFLEPHGYGKGINESVYNYIDFEKKQFFKRVGMVGLSDLSWTAITSEGAYYTANLAGEIAIDYKNPNMISENYTTSAWTGASVGDITMNAQGYIRVYTDVKPSGILYYELATPEIIDISEYLTDDNFIEVEGGGTIMTINENEYAYDVPTTISYVSTIGGNENE